MESPPAQPNLRALQCLQWHSLPCLFFLFLGHPPPLPLWLCLPLWRPRPSGLPALHVFSSRRCSMFLLPRRHHQRLQLHLQRCVPSMPGRILLLQWRPARDLPARHILYRWRRRLLSLPI